MAVTRDAMILRIEGPFVQEENDEGSEDVRTVTRWLVTAQLGDGRIVAPSWLANVYDRADMEKAVQAAVRELLNIDHPDVGSMVSV